MFRRIYKGGLTHLRFFLSSNISWEFCAKFECQRFLETGDASPNPCDYDDLQGGLTHLLFFISTNISLEFHAKVEGQPFRETGDVSRHGTYSM